jgi:hypothetical protein
MLLIEHGDWTRVAGGESEPSAGTLFTGWSSGYVASTVISEAGGLRALAAPLRLAVAGPAGMGFYSAWQTGQIVGTTIYNNQTVCLALADAIDYFLGTSDAI